MGMSFDEAGTILRMQCTQTDTAGGAPMLSRKSHKSAERISVEELSVLLEVSMGFTGSLD